MRLTAGISTVKKGTKKFAFRLLIVIPSSIAIPTLTLGKRPIQTRRVFVHGWSLVIQCMPSLQSLVSWFYHHGYVWRKVQTRFSSLCRVSHRPVCTVPCSLPSFLWLARSVATLCGWRLISSVGQWRRTVCSVCQSTCTVCTCSTLRYPPTKVIHYHFFLCKTH